MIRESLNANSKHAMMVVTPGSGVSFQRRTSTGGTSVDTTTTGRTAPQFLRLTRVGSTFTAYYSSNWNQLDTDRQRNHQHGFHRPIWPSCYCAQQLCPLHGGDQYCFSRNVARRSDGPYRDGNLKLTNQLSWIDHATAETGFKIERKTGRAELTLKSQPSARMLPITPIPA